MNYEDKEGLEPFPEKIRCKKCKTILIFTNKEEFQKVKESGCPVCGLSKEGERCV